MLDLHFVQRHARVQDKHKKTRTVPQNFAEFFPKTILTQYAYTQGSLKTEQFCSTV